MKTQICKRKVMSLLRVGVVLSILISGFAWNPASAQPPLPEPTTPSFAGDVGVSNGDAALATSQATPVAAPQASAADDSLLPDLVPAASVFDSWDKREHVPWLPTDDLLLPVAPPLQTPVAPSDAGAAPGIYGRITANGISAGNITLELRQYDAITETSVLTTTTDVTGNYRFDGVPSLPTGQTYYVRFGPNTTNPTYVVVWFGPNLSAYTTGQSLAGGDFDIANILLVSPPHGAISTLPTPFVWNKRNVPSDSYQWRLLDPDTNNLWVSAQLSYVDRYTLNNLPIEVTYGHKYLWFVLAYASADSYGVSYNLHAVRFSSDPAVSMLATALDTTTLTWTTGGDAAWYGQTSVSHDGTDAAQSGNLASSQNSWLETTVTGPGILSFQWRVSSLTAMKDLKFYVDGVEKLTCWSTDRWKGEAIAVPAGTHTVRWKFAPFIASPGDSGFVDEVVFMSGPALMVTSPNGGEIWSHRGSDGISWVSTEDVGPIVKIELYEEESLRHTTSASTENDGWFSYGFVPIWLEPSTNYRIKITSTAFPTIFDYSDSYFTIAESLQSSFGGLLVLPNKSSPSSQDYVYANADDHPELDVARSFTAEAWIYYAGDYNRFEGIINKFDSYMLNVGGYQYIDPITFIPRTYRCLGLTVDAESGPPGGGWTCRWPPPYADGWHHVAGVYHAELGQIRTYMDGDLFTDPLPFTGVIANSTEILQVGFNLVGGLDEVRISDVARYPAEPFPTTPFSCDASTRALWHFDEPQGATIFHDDCGADNVLVGYNGAHTEGVLPTALASVTIAGPMSGLINTAYPFTAAATPISATLPLTYTWSPPPQSGQNTPTVTYIWPSPGRQDITVTVSNAGSSVAATHSIVISDSVNVVGLSGVTIAGPDTGMRNLSYNFAVSPEPLNASQPIAYAWSPDPLSGQNTPLATYVWAASGAYQITVTATNAGGTVLGVHTIVISDDDSGAERLYLPTIRNSP